LSPDLGASIGSAAAAGVEAAAAEVSGEQQTASGSPLAAHHQPVERGHRIITVAYELAAGRYRGVIRAFNLTSWVVTGFE